jgi:hypothetical protein
MNSQSIQRHLAIAFAALTLSAAGRAQDADEVVAARSSQSERAVSVLAQRLGVAPAKLSLLGATQAKFPLAGRAAECFKVLDETSGEIHQVVFDERGLEADLVAFEVEEQTAHTARYGKLDPRLADALALVRDGELVKVAIWLREPQVEAFERLAPEEGEILLADEDTATAYFEGMDFARASLIGEVVGPLRALLDASGIEHLADMYAPVVHASLTPAELRELAQREDVDRLYLSEDQEEDLSVARQTINAHIVNSLGITGLGVRIAQIEVGGRIATANPFLAGTVQDGSFVCASASSHATGVAGILRSTHATTRGIAPAATLWAGGSCSGDSGQLQNRSTAAVNWGASALNLSWGSNTGLALGANDRFYDTMVMNRARTVVKSAGNRGAGCGFEGNVTSPGLAYNVIAVGNFNDAGTVSWVGDTMSTCSSWKDPISQFGDREKPEVSAPGTSITTTSTGGTWVSYTDSGTSFAAPMVTGTAALMIQRNAALASWPESVKAILMATATHNIEGATRLSEVDGAGGIVAYNADLVTRRILGNWGGVGYSCASAANVDMTTMNLVAGRKVRVVIAWDNDPAYASYGSKPSADLDLRVVNAANATVASSSSWDNTYEIVEFTPSVSGAYKLRVNKYRCDLSPRYLGWSWYQP